jgi:hypothetical protein
MEAAEAMREAKLVWEERELELTTDVHNNGTANPSNWAYRLIPELICRDLATHPLALDDLVPWDLPDSHLSLRLMRDNDGTCLVGQLQAHSSKGGIDDYWAYKFVPRLCTLPSLAKPILRWQIHRLRWVSRSLSRDTGTLRLPLHETTSVYVAPPARPDNVVRESPMVQFGICRVRKDGEEFAVWDNLPDALRHGVLGDWPDAQDLVSDPVRHLTRELIEAGIVHRKNRTGTHGAGTGIAPKNRALHGYALTRAMKDLPGSWQRLEPLQRVTAVPRTKRRGQALHGELAKNNNDTNPDLLYQALRDMAARGNPLPQVLLVEVWYSDDGEETAVHFLDVIRRFMARVGLVLQDGSEYRDIFGRDGFRVVLNIRRLGELVQEPTWSQAESAKVQEMLRKDSGVGQVLSCVVLPDMRYTHDYDPKNHIRSGFARHGRVTQFVVPVSDGEMASVAAQQKLHHAWLALLLSGGFMPGNLDNIRGGRNSVPTDVALTALWVVNRGRYQSDFPVAVRIVPPASCDGLWRIEARHARSDGEWLPYPEALCAVASYKREEKNLLGNDGLVQLAQNCLQRASNKGDQPQFLMGDSENLRWRWPKHWADNKLHFDNRNYWKSPGLRVARVNTSDTENPMWWVQGKNGVPGESSGLFQRDGEPQRYFYSLQKKSKTMRFWGSMQSNEERPEQFVQIPQLKGLLLSHLQEGDDAAAWAGYLHWLRGAAFHTDIPLERPLPLHLAKLFEDYVKAEDKKSRNRRRRGSRWK